MFKEMLTDILLEEDAPQSNTQPESQTQSATNETDVNKPNPETEQPDPNKQKPAVDPMVIPLDLLVTGDESPLEKFRIFAQSNSVTLINQALGAKDLISPLKTMFEYYLISLGYALNDSFLALYDHIDLDKVGEKLATGDYFSNLTESALTNRVIPLYKTLRQVIGVKVNPKGRAFDKLDDVGEEIQKKVLGASNDFKPVADAFSATIDSVVEDLKNRYIAIAENQMYAPKEGGEPKKYVTVDQAREEVAKDLQAIKDLAGRYDAKLKNFANTIVK